MTVVRAPDAQDRQKTGSRSRDVLRLYRAGRTSPIHLSKTSNYA